MRSLKDDVPLEACNYIEWCGCVMTQAFSGRSLTVEAWVQSQDSPCWTLWFGFPLALSLHQCSTFIHSFIHSFTAHRRYRRSYNLQSHYMKASFRCEVMKFSCQYEKPCKPLPALVNDYRATLTTPFQLHRLPSLNSKLRRMNWYYADATRCSLNEGMYSPRY